MLLRLIPVLFLFACTEQAVDGPRITPEPLEVTRDKETGISAFNRVARRVAPVATRVCRQQNPNAPRGYCNFRFGVRDNASEPANAFLTIDKSGRPVITFNIAMIRSVQNDDEIAFIMSHEAGHQIRNHLAQLGQQSVDEAVDTLTRSLRTDNPVRQVQIYTTFTRQKELEADEIGTYVAALSGYDPLVGAKSFARFYLGPSTVSTHPPSRSRLATVQRTVERIAAQRAAGQRITPP